MFPNTQKIPLYTLFTCYATIYNYQIVFGNFFIGFINSLDFINLTDAKDWDEKITVPNFERYTLLGNQTLTVN